MFGWRFSPSVLALLLVLSLVAPLHAQAVATLRPLPEMLQLAPGAEGTVEIVLDNARDVYGIDVRVAFDPAVLEVVDVDPARADVQMTAGTFPQPDFVAVNAADNAAGTLRYVVTQVNPTPPATGSGVVFSLRLRARVAGDTAITITSVEMADRDGLLLAVTPGAATITVVANSPVGPTGIPLRPNDTPAAEAPPPGAIATAVPASAASASPAAAPLVTPMTSATASINVTATQPQPISAVTATHDTALPPAGADTPLTGPVPVATMTTAVQAQTVEVTEPTMMESLPPTTTGVGIATDVSPIALGEANPTAPRERAVVGQSTGLTAERPAPSAPVSSPGALPYVLAALFILIVAAVWLARRGRS